MDPDLMGSSGQEVDIEQRISVLEISEYLELGHGKLRIDRIGCGHPFPVVLIPSDVRLDISAAILDPPINQRDIILLDLTLIHADLNRMHASIGLRNDQKSGSVLIEPMDDSWPFHSSDDRESIHMVDEGIDEGS